MHMACDSLVDPKNRNVTLERLSLAITTSVTYDYFISTASTSFLLFWFASDCASSSSFCLALASTRFTKALQMRDRVLSQMRTQCLIPMQWVRSPETRLWTTHLHSHHTSTNISTCRQEHHRVCSSIHVALACHTLRSPNRSQPETKQVEQRRGLE
jgi:hypothetical protein